MAPQPDKPRRVLHPRDLVCPRCGAGVDRPCSFAGRVHKEIHCTERLLALGDPGQRVEAAPGPPPPAEKPPPDPPTRRRPLPSAPSAATESASQDADDPPLTLFG